MSFIAAAVIGGGAALLGAGIEAGAASSAANTQASALQNAQNLQYQMFEQTQQNEAPYIQAGAGAESNLNYLLGIGTNPGTAPPGVSGGFGSLNAPFNAQTFQSMSPAYQFQLQQGRQGVLNQDASQQGAESGAAMKDLISFNQGFANTSFNNAFNQYQTQQQNTFNRLAGIAGLGQQAGSPSGTGATSFAQTIGNTAGQIGTAQAAGQIGVANAVSGGIQGAAGSYNMTQYLPWLLANQGGTAPASYPVNSIDQPDTTP
jgi:hypothetical protein